MNHGQQMAVIQVDKDLRDALHYLFEQPLPESGWKAALHGALLHAFDGLDKLHVPGFVHPEDIGEDTP